MITLDMSPARSSQLNKYKFIFIFRIFLQKSIDSEHPLNYPFGIINSIHSDRNQFILQLKFLANFIYLAGFDLNCFSAHISINANWESPDKCLLIRSDNAELFCINAAFNQSVCGIQKVIAMDLHMKSN